MVVPRHWAVGVAAASGAVLIGAGVVALSPALGSPNARVYASPGATPTGAGHSCASAKFATIGAAVAHAAPGATVVACPGTYAERVVIQKPLTLIGKSATVDAAGLPGAPTGAILGQQPYAAITVEASRVTITGLTVENAEGEGILAANPNPVAGPNLGGKQFYTGTPLHDVTIVNNVVKNNDVGYNDPSSPYVFCTPNGGSDCGGGIHLLSVANSTVRNNSVTGGADGILLTDEFGPNRHNLIKGNYVADNTKECGIVLPGHNLAFNPVTGKLDPSFGGVYRNTVVDNVVIDNGTTPYGGSGIGVFAPATFAASYDNFVSRNFIAGNGLGGISIHSHAANAYVNGNVFTHNVIGTNNLTLGDGTDTVTDPATTGIVMWSITPYKEVVAHNTIFANTNGIWYTPGTLTLVGLSTNHFHAVTNPVVVSP